MRIVLQRVLQSKVYHNKTIVTEIKNGYVLLVGFSKDEKIKNIETSVKNILKAKLFNEWCKNIIDLDYEILVLSQFTLFGQLKGTKLDFHKAEEYSKAKEMFNNLVECFKKAYKDDKIKNGLFGKHLEIELVNDGPVTVIFEY